EREIEIEAGLLAIGHDIKAGGDLIVECANDGVVLHLGEVFFAKGVQILAGLLQPGGKRIAADDGGAEWAGLHGDEKLWVKRIRRESPNYKWSAREHASRLSQNRESVEQFER